MPKYRRWLSGLLEGTGRSDGSAPHDVEFYRPILDPEGARVRASSGVSNWKGPTLQVLWFGEIKTAGKLDCSLSLRLPTKATSRLRLTLAGQSRVATAKGDENGSVTVRFSPFDIPTAGWALRPHKPEVDPLVQHLLDPITAVADQWLGTDELNLTVFREEMNTETQNNTAIG